MTKKKKQSNYLAKLILVFFLIGAAINIVAQSFSETYHPDLTTSLVILAFVVIFSVIILGDKIQDAL